MKSAAMCGRRLRRDFQAAISTGGFLTNRNGWPAIRRCHGLEPFADGWTSVRDQLQAAGVPPDHIFSADLCTASHPNVLCSYRRDGTPTGRMAAAIRSQPLRP
jgi:copper oxidase (laccase) domain-containing protein